MDFIELEKQAWHMASLAHEHQKYGELPYLKHVQFVYNRVCSINDGIEFKAQAKVVAILHDVIEDSNRFSFEDIDKIFGLRIRSALWYITKQKTESYFQYIERVRGNPIATLVKTCDLVENLTNSLLRDNTQNTSSVMKYQQALIHLSIRN